MPIPTEVFSLTDNDLENAIESDTDFVNTNILMYGGIALALILLYIKRR